MAGDRVRTHREWAARPVVACREVAAQAKALALTRSAAVNERLLQIVCVDAMQYGCAVNSCAVGRPAARAYRNLALLPSEIAFLTKAALFHAHVAAPLQPHPSLLGAAAHAAVRSLLPEPAELRVVPTVAPACAGGGGGGTAAEAAVTAVVCNGRIVSEYLHEPFEAETWAIVRQTLALTRAPTPESAPPPPCAACAAAALTPDANFCSICGERVRRATAPVAAAAVTVTAATAGVAAAAAVVAAGIFKCSRFPPCISATTSNRFPSPAVVSRLFLQFENELLSLLSIRQHFRRSNDLSCCCGHSCCFTPRSCSYPARHQLRHRVAG